MAICAAQWRSRIGSVAVRSACRVAPPSSHSRIRLCHHQQVRIAMRRRGEQRIAGMRIVGGAGLALVRHRVPPQVGIDIERRRLGHRRVPPRRTGEQDHALGTRQQRRRPGRQN